MLSFLAFGSSNETFLSWGRCGIEGEHSHSILAARVQFHLFFEFFQQTKIAGVVRKTKTQKGSGPQRKRKDDLTQTKTEVAKNGFKIVSSVVE